MKAPRPVLAWTALGLALATGLALAPGEAWAQWKWRDASGRITISDLPPPREVPDKDILQRPAPPRRAAAAASAPAAPLTAASAPASAPADRQATERQREAEREAQGRARAEEARLAAQRAENCQRARSQLTMLESGERMVQFNDKGERTVLDDARRAAEIRRVRDIIAAECR